MDRKRVVKDGYGALAEEYAAERSIGGRGTELVREFAADLPAGSLVLDAGCGAGVPATRVLAREHDVVGLDVSVEQLRLLRENAGGVPPVMGDLARLPVAAASFDGLVSLFAVIHVPREEHAAVFEEFARVLRPGGRLLVGGGGGAWEGYNPDWLDAGAGMAWSFHGAETNRELVFEAGFRLAGDELVDDELGGEFLFVEALRR